MFQRLSICSALVLFAWLPIPIQAQEKEVPLTVRVQVRSLSTLIDNIKLLVSLAGREEIATQVDLLIKTKVGPKGLEGIDPNRPIGFYSRFGTKDLNHADVNGVALVPIADEAAFLSLLTNLNFKAEKDAKTGIYTIKTTKDGFAPNVLFRFSDKYAYFTVLNLEALETKNLLTPKQVFSTKQTSAISAALRLDQLPKELKALAKLQLAQGLREAQDKNPPPNETPTQKELRLQVTKSITEQLSGVITDGKQIGIDIDVDKSSKEMSVTLSLTAQDDTELAKNINDLGRSKSLFAGLASKNPALHASVTAVVPKGLQAGFAAAFTEAQKDLLKNIMDEDKRKQTEQLLDAFTPTFKAGELDAAFTLQGPDRQDHYSGVIAVKVREGAALKKTIHKLLEDTVMDLPAQFRDQIKLNYETVHATVIHRFELGKHYDDKAKAILGESPVYIAFRDDAHFFVFGPDGLILLKTALANMKEAATPPVSLEISIARLLPFLPPDARKKLAVPESLKAGETGTIRFTVEGGPSLRVRLATQLSVVQFIGAALDQK